jgi:hypothetical protein
LKLREKIHGDGRLVKIPIFTFLMTLLKAERLVSTLRQVDVLKIKESPLRIVKITRLYLKQLLIRNLVTN